MPNRMIRDSARTSPTLAKLSHGAERCFWRLTTSADDYGRFNAEPGVIRGLCFPAMLAKVPERLVTAWLTELRLAPLISCYRVGDKHVGYFLTWDRHQRTRAKDSKFPPPTDDSRCCQMFSHVAEVEVVVVDTTEVVNTEGVAGRSNGSAAHAVSGAARIATVIRDALERSGRLGAVPRLRSPEFWHAEAGAAGGTVDLAAEVLKAEAWLIANPRKAPQKDLTRFLHNWLRRAKESQV